MPREIKILVPDLSADEYLDLHILRSKGEEILNYRYEIWDLNKDNPNSLPIAEFLRFKINALIDHWQVAEIFPEENNRIPILLIQNNLPDLC